MHPRRSVFRSGMVSSHVRRTLDETDPGARRTERAG